METGWEFQGPFLVLIQRQARALDWLSGGLLGPTLGLILRFGFFSHLSVVLANFSRYLELHTRRHSSTLLPRTHHCCSTCQLLPFYSHIHDFEHVCSFSNWSASMSKWCTPLRIPLSFYRTADAIEVYSREEGTRLHWSYSETETSYEYVLRWSDFPSKSCRPMWRVTELINYDGVILFNFRLPFRMLVRRYGCDLAYTPMIVSESFVLSEKARDVEFTTNEGIIVSTAKNFRFFHNIALVI